MFVASIRLKDDGFSDLSSSAIARYSDEATRESGHVMADAAMERLRKTLANKNNGGTMNIGASNRASKNFVMKLVDNGVGRARFEIEEGNDTIANQMIREGIPPERTPGPSINALRVWAGQKGIELVNPEAYAQVGKNIRNPTPDGYEPGNTVKLGRVRGYKATSKKGKPYNVPAHYRGRVVKAGPGGGDTGNIWKAALSAIRNALKKRGTERESANWWSKYPKGYGHFNYIAHVFDRNPKYWENALDRTGNAAVVAIVDFMTSGKRTRFSQRTIAPWEF